MRPQTKRILLQIATAIAMASTAAVILLPPTASARPMSAGPAAFVPDQVISLRVR